jgi:hypothetical protein
VATWSIPTMLTIGRESTQSPSAGPSVVYPPIPIPLYWQQALSDAWQLNYTLLPSSVSFQALRREWGYLGFTAGYQTIGYASVEGFFIGGNLNADLHWKIFDPAALDVSLQALPFYEKGAANVSFRLKIIPRYQISPTWLIWAGPLLTIQSPTQPDATSTLPEWSFPTRDNASTILTVPLEIGTSWSFARQWDLQLDYLYAGIGELNSAYMHTATVTFMHFW